MSEPKATYTLTTTVPPPDGYEYTGEFRAPRRDEIYLHYGQAQRAMTNHPEPDGPLAVLRPLPRPVSVSLPAEVWRALTDALASQMFPCPVSIDCENQIRHYTDVERGEFGGIERSYPAFDGCADHEQEINDDGLPYWVLVGSVGERARLRDAAHDAIDAIQRAVKEGEKS